MQYNIHIYPPIVTLLTNLLRLLHPHQIISLHSARLFVVLPNNAFLTDIPIWSYVRQGVPFLKLSSTFTLQMYAANILTSIFSTTPSKHSVTRIASKPVAILVTRSSFIPQSSITITVWHAVSETHTTLTTQSSNFYSIHHIFKLILPHSTLTAIH